MEIKVGPYKIMQRTEYSKLRILDENNKNILDSEIGSKIISDYNKQSSDPEKYFSICGAIVDKLINYDIMECLFIPEGVVEIGDFAFSELDFTMLSFPSTLRTICDGAFYNCEKIKHLEIPDSVKAIGGGAFDNCYLLEKVKLPSSIEKLEDELFADCRTLRKIDVPDSVEYIGARAFLDCTSLEGMHLPKNLKILNSCAFKGCNRLKEVTFSPNLEAIGQDAFVDTNIKNVILPDSVKRIDANAFSTCKKLETVKLPNNLSKLSKGTFSYCYNLRNIILPDSIEIFETYVFYDARKLNNINIPKKLNCVFDHALGGSGIRSLTFNHDLENIKFVSNCDTDLIFGTNIDKLIINKNVKTITKDAFIMSGSQITKIDYCGTKEQFKEFKNNNESLFKILSNVEEINFMERILEDEVLSNLER